MGHEWLSLQVRTRRSDPRTRVNQALDSFEAEVKRSWLTPRDSLKAAMKGGKPWIPATVTLTESDVRILSGDGSVELRPLRIIWLAPNSFRVTGVVSGSGFGRSSL